MRQSLGDIFMYGGFADAEFSCGIPHGGPILNYVNRQVAGALFHIPFDVYHSPEDDLSKVSI